MTKIFLMAIALMGLTVGNALAQAPPPTPDCTAMIKQVRDQVGNRFDGGRYTAQELAAAAEKLAADKKPAADCVAKAQEAAKAAGLSVK
jgi:uncharacterized iron-regulated protein